MSAELGEHSTRLGVQVAINAAFADVSKESGGSVVAFPHVLKKINRHRKHRSKKKNGKNQMGRVTAEKGAADFYTSYLAPVESRVSNNSKAGLLNTFDVSTWSLHLEI